jgi:hypothetical protein
MFHYVVYVLAEDYEHYHMQFAYSMEWTERVCKSRIKEMIEDVERNDASLKRMGSDLHNKVLASGWGVPDPINRFMVQWTFEVWDYKAKSVKWATKNADWQAHSKFMTLPEAQAKLAIDQQKFPKGMFRIKEFNYKRYPKKVTP